MTALPHRPPAPIRLVTPADRPSLYPVPDPEVREATIVFLNTLFACQHGWVEVVVAEDAACTRLARVTWCFVAPGSAPAFADELLRLGYEHGNVYVSSTAFREKRRSATTALPSPIIFVDDAPESDAYSMVVETSAGRYHAYLCATEPLLAEDRALIQRRAAAALGADPSGADVTQLVRVPGTANTKYGARFPVRLVVSTGQRYTVEELWQRWPETSVASVASIDIDSGEVEFWLGNLGALLDAHGIPRRCLTKKSSHTYRVLTGQITLKSGSERRYAVTKGLVMFGYSNPQIAAMLIAVCDYGRSARSGMRALVADVDRCIAKARAALPGCGVTSVRLNTPLPPRTLGLDRPAGRGGARRKLTADGLLAYYRANTSAGAVALLSIADVAAALKVSAATIKRVEAELRARGLIRRVCTPDRHGSSVLLCEPAPEKDWQAELEALIADVLAMGETLVPRRMAEQLEDPARRQAQVALVARAEQERVAQR